MEEPAYSCYISRFYDDTKRLNEDNFKMQIYLITIVSLISEI